MTKLRIVTAKEMEKILLTLGFEKIRQKGSHAFYRHKDGRSTTIPHHPGRTLARPLIHSILKNIQLSIKDFNDLL